MARPVFLLELEDWDTEVVGRYRTLATAKLNGLQRYPHNAWQIRDGAGALVYHHDPYSVVMGQEQERFQTTERWRQVFREREEAQAEAQVRVSRQLRMQALMARLEMEIDWHKVGF